MVIVTRALDLAPARWTRAVQYRHPCDGCGETKMVAVIKRRGRAVPLRLCKTCYLDGFWRIP